MNDFKEYVQLMLICILITAVVAFASLSVAYYIGSTRCEAQWGNNKPNYGLVQGCMIEIEGRRIPAESYRVTR